MYRPLPDYLTIQPSKIEGLGLFAIKDIPAYEVNQLDLIKAAAVRQKWIDQGQSTNVFMSLDKANDPASTIIFLF